MDDAYLMSEAGGEVYVATALSDKVYREAGLHNMGGAFGWFICTWPKSRPEMMEVLVKAKDAYAAQRIFCALIAANGGEA